MSSTSVKEFQKVSSSAANDELTQKRLPKAVCWHEGMMLSPHHFQQNHQYWEGQVSRILSTLSSDYWGIAELAVNYADILDGKVTIERLLAIMPDGLIVDYDIKVDDPLSVALDDVGSEPIAVQLTVPIQVAGSASERSEIQRYISKDDKPRIDENTGDNEIIMPRLQPMLSLQLGNQVGKKYISLPLFRVVKPEGGSLQIDSDYCAPLLKISADKFRAGTEELPGAKPLQQRAKALALSIRHKSMQLAGLSEEGEDLGIHINQRHHRWIRAMVQNLPGFELIADSADSTPRALYESLISMAGPISELSTNSIPPRFNAYHHDDHLGDFNKVVTYIQQQINRVNLSYSTLSFDQEKESVFTLQYESSWTGKDLIIEVKPSSSGNREGMMKWIKSARIASIQLHKDLAKRRLLGIRAELIERDEKSGIVPATGNALFKIKADTRFINPGSKLVIASTSSQLKSQSPENILVHMPHE